MTHKIKAGIRIELRGTPALGGFPAVEPELATIAPWRVKVNGPRENRPGYHVVRFDDGGGLLVHENSFRVIG